MDLSKICQSQQEYSCGNAIGKVNLYNGRLLFEYPLLSIGANNFQINTALVYNSQYQNTDFDGKLIGFGDGWKLKIQQYVLPYKTTYNINGFNEGDYLYLDSNWFIHRFVYYKTTTDGKLVYYDNFGTGLKLYVLQNNTSQIIDEYHNTLCFDSKGKIVEVISGVNKVIVKKIAYVGNNIDKIYDIRKSERVIQFNYNTDNKLLSVTTTCNDISYEFEYNNKQQLYTIIKSDGINRKNEMYFVYNQDKILSYAIKAIDLTTLRFFHYYDDEFPMVRRVYLGAMQKKIKTVNEGAETVLGDDIRLGEDYYLSEDSIKFSEYEYVMSDDYTKETINFKYNYSYTDIVNEKNIVIRNYFDSDGRTITTFENEDINTDTGVMTKHYSLFEHTGLLLSTNGLSNTSVNNEAANILNTNTSFTYTISNELLSDFKDKFKRGTKAYEELFQVSFFLKTSKTINNNATVTLTATTNEQKFENKVILANALNNSWQYVTIPIDFKEQLQSVNNMTLKFNGFENDCELLLASVKIKPGHNMDLMINGYKMGMDSQLTYGTLEGVKTSTISPTFYMTESDLFATYKSLYFSLKNGDTYYDLVLCNNTTIIPVSYVGLIKPNGSLEYFLVDVIEEGKEADKPNYYLKLVDWHNKNMWTRTELQTRFQYDATLKKHYYETKNMTSFIFEDVESELSDTNSAITYNWQNEDGTFRASKDEYKVVRENFYDTFGNITSSSTYQEGKFNEKNLTITYNYGDVEVNEREMPISYTENDMTVYIDYDYNFNRVNNSISGNLKISYLYDNYNENIIAVEYINIETNEVLQRNDIAYSKNNNMKYMRGLDDVTYGFRYNIFSEVEKIYANKNLIMDRKFEKNILYDKEIMNYNYGKDHGKYRNTYYETVISYNDYGKERIIKNNECVNKYNGETHKIENTKEEKRKIFLSHYIASDVGSQLIGRISNITDSTNNLSKQYTNYMYSSGKYYDSNDYIKEQYSVNDIERLKKTVFPDSSVEYVLKTGYLGTQIEEKTKYSVTKDGKVINIPVIDEATGKNSVQKLTIPMSPNQRPKKTTYTKDEEVDVNSYAEFSHIYEYDNLNRCIKKTSELLKYPITDVSEITINTEKNISYEKNTTKLKDITYIVNSNLETFNDNVQTYFTHSNMYNELGNITQVYEYGNCFRNIPNKVTSRKTKDIPTRRFFYEYDILNRIKKETNPILGVYEYTYSQTSGMLSKVQRYSLDGELLNTISFTDESGKLTRIEKDGIIYIVQYDNYGNVIKIKDTNLTYNYDGKLENYASSDNTNVKYYYDPQGVRYKKEITKDSTHKTINYFIDGNRIIGEDWLDADSNVTAKIRYFYDAEGITGLSYNGTNYSLIKDSLGNIRRIMQQGKIVCQYIYDAWGNHIVLDENDLENLDATFIGNINPFRYKGYYYDVETQLFYCNSRYYSPELCRWISPDSIEYLDPQSINGLNLYCYCYNDPINYYDPSGHFAVTTLIILGLIGVGAVVGGTVAGVSSYNNGNTGWELVGDILGGALIGGAIGGIVGYFAAPSIAAMLSSTGTIGGALAFAGGMGSTGAGIAISSVGQLALAGAVTSVGVLSGITVMAAQTRKSGGYYGERWPGDPHKPDHVHLRGNGIDIRIGRDGKPLPGEDKLGSQARKALERLWDEFVKLFNRW